MIKHLLVHLDGSERAAVRLGIAVGLARRFGAHLTGLFAQSDNSVSGLVARRASDHLKAAADQARLLFDARTAEAGLSSEWWQLDNGEYAHVIGETVICSRYADMVIFGQHDPSGRDSKVPEDLVEQVILNAGRPVLVIPCVGDYPVIGQRAAVAWNASREAARAVNDAIPLMTGAKAVTILALHAASTSEQASRVPRVDIVRHLAHHGIEAHLERMSIDDIGVVDMLLSRLCDEGADLLVMGGHGNYGFPFLHRGGNTRHILRQMTLPVLFSH